MQYIDLGLKWTAMQTDYRLASGWMPVQKLNFNKSIRIKSFLTDNIECVTSTAGKFKGSINTFSLCVRRPGG